MRIFTPIRPLLTGWLVSLLCFGLLAFVFVGEFARMVAMPFTEALWIGASHWLPWAILTPLLFRLSSRMPLGRGRWKWSLPVHMAAAALTMAFCVEWGDLTMALHRTLVGPSFFESHGPRPVPGGGSPQGAGERPHFPGQPPHSSGLFVVLAMRMPIYVTLLSIAHAVHFYRRAEERERRALELTARLTQSRLETLKMQLQPHFLFNTLNSIAELVHQDADAADAMLASLSELLRLTLETASDHELPLRRELQIVERYLAIEQVRFRDRLRFELDIPPETREALVPAFLLQPLVENALRHGLEPQSAAGLLTIHAARDGNTLRLRISDNGRGLREDEPIREGIGLGNTRARLSALYGDEAKLALSDTDGLTVDILIPFRTAS